MVHTLALLSFILSQNHVNSSVQSAFGKKERKQKERKKEGKKLPQAFPFSNSSNPINRLTRYIFPLRLASSSSLSLLGARPALSTPTPPHPTPFGNKRSSSVCKITTEHCK
jgi:hypothetical protein